MKSVRSNTLLVCFGLAALLGGCSLAAAVDRELIPEETNSGQPRGVLGGYANGEVWGWAAIVDQEAAVQVRIEVDGTNVATVTANEMRDDLVEAGLHPTGEAGFHADVGDLAAGAVVHAFVVGTSTELTGSPLTVE